MRSLWWGWAHWFLFPKNSCLVYRIIRWNVKHKDLYKSFQFSFRKRNVLILWMKENIKRRKGDNFHFPPFSKINVKRKLETYQVTQSRENVFSTRRARRCRVVHFLKHRNKPCSYVDIFFKSMTLSRKLIFSMIFFLGRKLNVWKLHFWQL